MKNDAPIRISKRFLILAFFLILLLGFVDRLLFNTRVEEARSKTILDALNGHKTLSNELHAVFYRVQDDFYFFEKNIVRLLKLKPNSVEYKNILNYLVEFLETHPGYFKVRIADHSGQELLKLVQDRAGKRYFQSLQLFNLSEQSFYQELNKVPEKAFYFSSMEPNIINGVIETPVRPTVRVSKRLTYNDYGNGLLILNIDGRRILDLFQSGGSSDDSFTEKSLLDSEGKYVAGLPGLPNKEYSPLKISLKERSPSLYKALLRQTHIQGAIDIPGELVVFSQMLLPNTKERWFLISRYSEVSWRGPIFRELLTWVFWEIFFLVFFLTWLWKDEKKRHRDEVVKVLLKERSEFIQNVSHQLKTPLSIMINELEKNVPTQNDWHEIKKEMNHLIKVVEDMLLLAQVDALAKLPLKQEDLLEIVSGAVDMIGPKAKGKGVLIRFNVDEKLLASHNRLEVPVMGELLKSAIFNLIDNAIDYSPVGETVDVFVSYTEGRFLINVKDNGPGIPDEFLPKLFLRFSRNEPNKTKGSGIGLSITKKIVELHNGEVTLLEHRKGTIFQIRL